MLRLRLAPLAAAALLLLPACAADTGSTDTSATTASPVGSSTGTKSPELSPSASPDSSTQSPTATGTDSPSPSSRLQAAATSVLAALADRDYAGLAALAGPEGVRFSPWGFVDVEGDVRLTPEQVAGLGSDSTRRDWGAEAGSGEPIRLTWAVYDKRFGYSHDFGNADVITENGIVEAGSTTNNIATAYPGADYVDYHVKGTDPEYDGLDWASLRVVLMPAGGGYELVGLVHDSWTP